MKLDSIPSLSLYLDICPTCAIVILKSKKELPFDSSIQPLIEQMLKEFEIAIPFIERSSIVKLMTLEEHESTEKYHSNWIKINEKFNELGQLYSPDKGTKRSIGTGSSKGSKNN